MKQARRNHFRRAFCVFIKYVSQSSVIEMTEKLQSEKSGGVYVTFFSSQPGKCRSVN